MEKSSIVLFILVVGTMMGALDSTIVILAFPTINDTLQSSLVVSIWIILAYMLIAAVMTTPSAGSATSTGGGRCSTPAS